MILTTYLTSLPDPQRRRNVRVAPNDHGLMQLHPGCSRHRAELVILHDELHDQFTSIYENHSTCFIKVAKCPAYSLNDWRFFLFRDLLADGFAPSDEVVWISDLFDVRLNRHPDEMVEIYDDDLFIGRQPWCYDQATRRGRNHCKQMVRWYGEVLPAVAGQPILMAGTWGGRRKTVLRFLTKLCKEIEDLQPGVPGNCNMAAFNKVAYCNIGRDGFWCEGEPLHSVLGTRDTDNKRVAFVHK